MYYYEFSFELPLHVTCTLQHFIFLTMLNAPIIRNRRNGKMKRKKKSIIIKYKLKTIQHKRWKVLSARLLRGERTRLNNSFRPRIICNENKNNLRSIVSPLGVIYTRVYYISRPCPSCSRLLFSLLLLFTISIIIIFFIISVFVFSLFLSLSLSLPRHVPSRIAENTLRKWWTRGRARLLWSHDVYTY